MTLDKEHTVTLGGKTFVLYSGLLAMAHAEELQEIDEEFIQLPNNENGFTAIIKAIARTKDGRSFSGVGDANEQNTGRQVAKHYIRMASTRAKARALRDLCNVGVTALEELGDDTTEAPSRSSTGQRRGGNGQDRQTAPAPPDRDEDREELATDTQIDNVRFMCATLNAEGDPTPGITALEERAGYPLTMMTQREIQRTLDILQVKVEKEAIAAGEG